MSQWDKLVNAIEDSEYDADFEGAVSEEEVQEAEKELGIRIPEQYRKFLLNYGCGDIEGIQIYGLGVEPDGAPSLLWLIDDLKKNFPLPETILPFSESGDGSYAAVVVEDFDEFETGNVIYWDPIHLGPDTFEVAAESFAEYILDLMEG